MKKLTQGAYVYWINEFGEHIPAQILKIKTRVKIFANDLTGDREIWVSKNRIQLQEVCELLPS